MWGNRENSDAEMREEQCNNAGQEYRARGCIFKGENDFSGQSSNDGKNNIERRDISESYCGLRRKDESAIPLSLSFPKDDQGRLLGCDKSSTGDDVAIAFPLCEKKILDNSKDSADYSRDSRFSVSSCCSRFSDLTNNGEQVVEFDASNCCDCNHAIADYAKSAAEDASSLSSSELDDSPSDSSDISWVHSTLSYDNISTFGSTEAQRQSHWHFGDNLSGFSDESNEVKGICSDFLDMTVLKTTSVGTRKAFIVTNDNCLKVIHLRKRIALDFNGPVTFIESSQLCRFRQCGHGSVIAFKQSFCDNWKLGIVRSIFPMNDPPAIDLFEWTGGVSDTGVPSFASPKFIETWDDISSHFTLREFDPANVEIVFLNQVRGIPIGNNPVYENTRNCSDGGIQCSSDGPDIFSPNVPTFSRNDNRSHFIFGSVQIGVDDVAFSDVFVANTKNKRRRSQIAAKIRTDAPEAVHRWNKRCNFTVKNTLPGSFFVVMKQNQKPVTKGDVSMTPADIRGKFLVPDMRSYDDNQSPFQYFSPLSSAARRELEKKCRFGVSPREFDELVSKLSDSPRSIVLLSISKIENVGTTQDYTGKFAQIFAGGGSPTPDSTYERFNIPNSELTVYHKKAFHGEFNSFIPLSTSCFDSKFHGIRVLPQFVDIISKALGKRGIFPSRSCSSHIGHSSYIGLRAKKSRSLPSPSEGPTEHGRWYYRQYINHIYWPFVLKLYNRLGRNASRMDFYIYKHLGVLFPYANSHRTKIRYSRLLIATINFECTNHCDNVDLVAGNVRQNMIKDLEIIARDKDIGGFSKRISENSINFLNSWDISVPTTCCYQILKDLDSEQLTLEVIQFFCLSGLGICYRIIDYWSHCFMASSFYHCTSTALYRIDDKIFAGSYPGVNIFAWGKGGSADNPNQGRNEARVAGGAANEHTVEDQNRNGANEDLADNGGEFPYVDAGGAADNPGQGVNETEAVGVPANEDGGTNIDRNASGDQPGDGAVESGGNNWGEYHGGDADGASERSQNMGDQFRNDTNEDELDDGGDSLGGNAQPPDNFSNQGNENDNESESGRDALDEEVEVECNPDQENNDSNHDDNNPNEMGNGQDGHNSEDSDEWGSGGEHGDGFGPGHGEGEDDSDSNSERSQGNRNNNMSIDHAMVILGINHRMDMNEASLNRIYRRQMLSVHPDRARIHGLSAEQATLRSQRLNDAVQAMRIHLNLPPGQNLFQPIDVDDSNSDDNN